LAINITGKITLSETGLPIEEGFRDGDGNPADGTEAFFGIVHINEDKAWTPLGTGFFISNNGLFATAKHVLLDRNGNRLTSLAGLHLSRQIGKVVIRKAIKFACHPSADVAVGFLADEQYQMHGKQTVNKCFSLTRRHPKVGDKVVSIAYPNGVVDSNERGFSVKISTTVTEGQLEEYYPAGRDRVLLPGPCFRTSMPIQFGASGGPVAFGNGSVFAINSTGWDGTDIGFLSPIQSLFELSVENVRLFDEPIRESISLEELAALGLIRVV